MSHTVAVIGGGYGGAAVAKALDGELDVVLIEPKDSFVHAAGSLRSLVRPDWAENMFFAYDRLLQRGNVIRESAASVDPVGVTLASGARVDADYLVLASGSDYPYPAKMNTDSTADALARLHATHRELSAADRVLIVGAGPVGLELAGEIRAVWPTKQIVVVGRAEQLLPGFAPQMRADLHRQLHELAVDLRLGTKLDTEPPTEPGVAQSFTISSSGGELSADIWFRCYGVDVNSDYLGDRLLTDRNAKGQVPVTETLNVAGHEHVYAIGDITDLAEAKMAGYAMKHAEVVARNIIAQAHGEKPTATYLPAPVPSIILPLGPERGVGQVPASEGPTLLTAPAVAEYKGTDLFIGRFITLFNVRQ